MPPSRHILSFAEYAAVRHPTPYVVEVARDGARLLLFGGRHSSQPADPMFDQIEAAFAKLSPAFALHEGTPPAVEIDREIGVLRRQQQAILHLLKPSEKPETNRRNIMTKEKWTAIMRATGFTDEEMNRWHVEFERSAPEDHQQFLEYLHIGAEEVARIREWSRNGGVKH